MGLRCAEQELLGREPVEMGALGWVWEEGLAPAFTGEGSVCHHRLRGGWWGRGSRAQVPRGCKDTSAAPQLCGFSEAGMALGLAPRVSEPSQ